MAGKAENKDRTKATVMAEHLTDIQKKYSGSVIGRYSEIGKNVHIKKISTGSLSADYVLGGGFARMVEIVGLPSTGKTTLAFTAIAKKQREDPDANIVYIDAEYEVDPVYAVALGVDFERLIFVQPESTTDGYNIIEEFIQSGVVDMIVLDSIAAMIPPEYTQKEIGEAIQIGAFARITTQAIARINRLSAQFDVNMVFINQYKDAVNPNGIPGGSGTVMGNTNKYAPGGPSKDFYFQQILETKRVRQIKASDGNVKSNVYEIRTIKNKVAPPYRKGEIVITFGFGLDLVQELFGLAVSFGIITGTGKYMVKNPDTGENLLEKYISGRDAMVELLETDQHVYGLVHDMVHDKLDHLTDNGTNRAAIGNIDATAEELAEHGVIEGSTEEELPVE